MRIVLHIGLEKTGTTSIQVTLRNNRALLAESGINVEQCFLPNAKNVVGNSLGLVAATLDGKKKESFLHTHRHRDIPTDFSVYGNSQSATGRFATTVLSSEHLSSWVTQEIEVHRLKAFLDQVGAQTVVVAYLRRQDRLAQSLFNEYVKSGGTFSHKNLNRVLSPHDQKLKFVDTIKTYAEIFGHKNLIVKEFAKRSLKDNDVVSDFIDVLGAGGLPIERPRSANTSLCLEALYVLSMINDLDSIFGKSEESERARKEVRKHGGGKLRLLTKQTARSFLANFDEANAELSAALLKPDFFDKSFQDYGGSIDSIDQEKLRALLAIPAVASLLGQRFSAN